MTNATQESKPLPDAETLRRPAADLLEEHGYGDVAALLREIADSPFPPRVGSIVRIAKPPWRYDSREPVWERLSANTSVGAYRVMKDQGERYWTVVDPLTGTERRFACSSMVDGMRQAELHYAEQLMECVGHPLETLPDGHRAAPPD